MEKMFKALLNCWKRVFIQDFQQTAVSRNGSSFHHRGGSCIREMVFEDRYKAADQLRKMGARIRVQGNEAVICGVKTLHGAAVQAQELRGGAS